MPQTFIVDQAATFQAVAFLSAEPKLVFGSRDKQETSPDGIPKWQVELVAGFHQFGKVTSEVIKVSVTSYKNPGEGLAMYTPVHLVNFTVGVNAPEERVNDKTGQKRIVGGTAWYRCDEIRSALAPVSSKS
jgi:hypothetical protein